MWEKFLNGRISSPTIHKECVFKIRILNTVNFTKIPRPWKFQDLGKKKKKKENTAN